MDKNNSNKKPKLNKSLVESNVEHKNMSQQGIDIGTLTAENVSTTTNDIKQSNASRVDIPKS